MADAAASPPERGEALTDLLRSVVSGKLPAGQSLPGTSQLATEMGVTQRQVADAVNQLSEWRVLGPGENGDTQVRPAGDWSMRVISVLRDAWAPGTLPPVSAITHEAVQLTRVITLLVARTASVRLAKGQLDPARAHLEQAWHHRTDPNRFLVHHYLMTRSLLETSGLYTTLWLVNDLAELNLALMRGAHVPIPDDYQDSHLRFFEALERGDEADATAAMSDYMDRYEQNVVAQQRNHG